MIGFSAGVGFLLFGYDQGVMGSLLTLNSFTKQFPAIDTTGKSGTSHAATLQGATIGLYEIGCFLGAVATMIWGDEWGRRKVIWIGSVIMAIGAIIQCSSYGLAQLIVARIITGVGNGMHTATIPVWQSECSPPHRRGALIMIEGALITGGIMVSYWVDFALYWADPNPVAWRFPIAFQLILIFPTFLTIWMPESPRWLLLKGRESEAREVLSALDEVPMDDPTIEHKVREIKESIELAAGVGMMDLLKQGKERNFHRTSLGFVIQMFQQISGINLITYYAGTIFEKYIGLSPLNSRILAACNGTEYFLASWIAVYTIEKYGRRKLMLFGAVGMSLCMAVLTATNSPTALKPDAEGKATVNGPPIVSAVFLFLFNSFFAVGWLGMTWLYPAEITPLSIRASANGVSTSANWLFNFMVVLITPIAFETIKNYTYLIFCIINALMVPAVYITFPETAGRSLEEMDAIFARSSYWNPYDVVRKERETPRRYDEQGRPIDLMLEAEESTGHAYPEKKATDDGLQLDTASGRSSN
ncbi:putative sugar transporter [Violaceomyces palustris]|uniref:Sugar transporter n=1 Tax=Violaceomyces palustris TaxID=1673888 RepID=A0ACD0P5Y6_9BASI|nr:putative sugar transporter [Violaceomyces palustris]